MSPEDEAEIVALEIDRLFARRASSFRKRVLASVIEDASCRASLIKAHKQRATCALLESQVARSQAVHFW